MSTVTVFVFPDLLPWENHCLSSLWKGHEEKRGVTVIPVTDFEKNYLKKNRVEGPIWVLSRNFRQALAFLGARGKQRIYCSSMQISMDRPSLSTLLWKRMGNRIPSWVKILAHSPLDSRFYEEFEGLPSHQILPIPLPVPVGEIKKEKSDRLIRVGILGEFTPETNLNYFANIAHYVAMRKPSVLFHIIGQGPLYFHLARMGQELGISERFQIVEASDLEALGKIDLMLYLPLRNHHFIPVLAAAAYRLPVVSVEIPGIELLIKDGHSGFIVPTNETKSLGELVLRLCEDANLREALGTRLSESLTQKYSAEALWPLYRQLFLAEPVAERSLSEAA
jgi:glycosyltransferase involved in cell wall biosynthesis